MEQLKLLDEISLNSPGISSVYLMRPPCRIHLKFWVIYRRPGSRRKFIFEPAKIAKQLKYADKKSIPFVVMCGPDEKERGEATIKMMKPASKNHTGIRLLVL